MTTITAAGVLLTADQDSRVLRYRILPFGEPGQTSVGLVTASADSRITLPATPDAMHLNLEHDRKRPVGKGVSLDQDANGLVAAFRIAETTAGNDLLAEAADGLRPGASVEIRNVVIRAGRLVSGVLEHVGAVVQPAFPSALLTAADAGTDAENPTLPDAIVIDGVEYVRKDATEPTPEDQPEGDIAATSAESEENMGTTLTAAAAAAAGMTTHGAESADTMTASQAFAQLASAFRSGGQKKQSMLLAALTNVVHDDGDNDGDGLGEIAAVPEWLGEVYKKAAYVRKYIPLCTQGTLTAYQQKGFNFGTLPVVAKYTGNKADVPTGGMTATPISYLVERWAHAADLDRRFIDFGDTEVVQAFVEAQVESYKKVTDVETLVDIIAAANTFTPGTVPSGINATLAAIVDGALTLIAADFNPTFAIVGSDIYRSLALTKKDEVPEYLASSVGLKVGEVDGFQIIPSSHANALQNVIVGDGSTIRFKELGGGAPIRVEAEHIAQGGKDFGVFGYTSFQELIDGGVVKADIVP